MPLYVGRTEVARDQGASGSRHPDVGAAVWDGKRPYLNGVVKGLFLAALVLIVAGLLHLD